MTVFLASVGARGVIRAYVNVVCGVNKQRERAVARTVGPHFDFSLEEGLLIVTPRCLVLHPRFCAPVRAM